MTQSVIYSWDMRNKGKGLEDDWIYSEDRRTLIHETVGGGEKRGDIAELLDNM